MNDSTQATTDRRFDLLGLAFDHRRELFELARQAGASEERLPALKRLLIEAVGQVAPTLGRADRIGVVVDERYGSAALDAAAGRGWWVARPVELPDSNPLVFEWGRSIGSHLASWPKDHVVKCLVRFHPDDEVYNRLEQEAQIKGLFQAVQVSHHELMLEIAPPASLPRTENMVYRAIKRLYNLGIRPQWWRLEPMSASQWRALDALIEERDPDCRGVLLRGEHATGEQLTAGFMDAQTSRTCRGFIAGIEIFFAPIRRWLAGEIDDLRLVREVAQNFDKLIEAWQRTRRTNRENIA